MWSAIEWLIVIGIVLLLWFIMTPKKQPFTGVLNNGEHIEGSIRYSGRADNEAIKAEIISQLESKLLPGESIARIWLG